MKHLAVKRDGLAREGHAQVIHVHVVAACFGGGDVGRPPHARHAVVPADGMHEALQDAVAVLRPEVDELAQRLFVEVLDLGRHASGVDAVRCGIADMVRNHALGVL